MNGILKKISAFAGSPKVERKADSDSQAVESHADFTLLVQSMFEANPDYAVDAVGSALVTVLEARRIQRDQDRSSSFRHEYTSRHRDMLIHVGAIK